MVKHALVRLKCSGFTLSEVLIALALLGIVVAFSIPKILNSVGEAELKARFKETEALVYDVLYSGVLSGGITQTSSTPYIRDHLNTVRYCTYAITEGCDPNAQENVNAAILPNGVILSDLDGVSAQWAIDNPGELIYGLEIDLNGPKVPNQEGQDRIVLNCNVGQIPIASNGMKTGQCWGVGNSSRNRINQWR